MSSRLKENFLRHAILVVDHSKDALISLVDLELSNNGLSFEHFINKNQHEIYHLHNNSRCCQCPNGYYPQKSSRILHGQQMDLLFDRTSKKPCHKSGRSGDYCCSTAMPGLRTAILDLTLARCLLVNFCLDVFWYSCLNQQGKTLEDFLDNHKHDIYHLWQYNTPCCQCPASGFKFPSSRLILDQTHWIQLFNALKLPCLNHKKRPSPGSMHSICSVAAMSGISVTHLNTYLSKVILQNFCSLWQTVETLVQIRNVDYGHATAGEMTDQEYNKSVNTIELNIMVIGQVCNKETYFKGVIHEAKHGTLQYTLFEKYKDSLIENLARQDELNKNVTGIVIPQLNRLADKIASKAEQIPTAIAAKMPKIIGDSIQQFHETDERKQTDQDNLQENLKDYLNRIQCQTALEIQCHVNEGTFVETNAVRKFIANAEKFDVFVIYGSKGVGKTCTGLEILRQFGMKDKSYTLIKISDIKKVDEVIKDTRKIVILLDDVFRTKYCPCNSDLNVNQLDLLNARRSAGNLKIIFTIGSIFRKSFKDLLYSHRLFKGHYQIDLALLQFCMTDHEKEEILSKFCKKQKIQIRFNQMQNVSGMVLDKNKFNEIVQTDPYMGYPTACYLFTSNKCYFRLGLRFFEHTSSSLIDDINALSDVEDFWRFDLVSYATLVYILLCNSSISLNNIDIRKVKAIMQLGGSSKRFTRRCNIIDSLKRMDGTYLMYDSSNQVYKFKHQMVYEAVAISYFDIDPDTVVDVLTFEFISAMIRLQNNNFKQTEEVFLVIPEDQYITLAKQLIRILHKDYQTKSFKFVEMLCDTRLMLEDNADFVNILLKEFETCIFSEETDLSYLDNTIKVKFYFCSALLLYLTRKQNVDNSITVTLYFMERLIKDGIDPNLVSSCKKTILAIFDYLCASEEVDTISAFIVQPLTEWGIDCNFNEFIYRAIDNEKNNTASFLLQYLSQEINLVELIMNMDAVKKPRVLSIANETFKISSSCSYRGTDVTELIKWLITNTPDNTFNINNIIITSASKNLVSLLTWCLLETNLLIGNVNGVIYYAFQNGWEEVLIILMDKKMFNPNDVVYIFNTAVGKSMARLVILLLTRYPSFCDVQLAFTSALEDNNFITMKCLILNVKNPLDMRMIMNSILYQLDSCQIYPFYDWLLQEEDKQIQKSVFNNNDNLQIIKWSLTNFTSHRKTLVERIYETLNSNITKYVDILQWFVVNMAPSVLPIKYVMDMAVQKRFTKVLIWILKNYDHQQCNLLDHATEVCKSKDRNLIEIYFSNVDHGHMNLASVMQTMIATNPNSQCSEQVLWMLQNVDHTLFNMKMLMNTACKHEQMDIVKYLFKNVDHTLFDIKTILDAAIVFGSLDIVKYVIGNVDRTLFDMKVLLNEACDLERLHIVTYLIENVDHTLYDMKTAMNEACQNGGTNIVEYLIENVDHTLFDMVTAMNEACQYGSLDIVKYLMKNFDFTLFDIKAAMHGACGKAHFDIMKYMIENCNHALFDMHTVMHTACKEDELVFFKYLMDNVDHTLFDMKTAMNEACLYASFYIVEYLMENVDHTLFDMKTAMNEVGVCGSLDIVEYMMENVDHKLFDMKTAMNEACQYGSFDMIKYLIENFDFTLFDIEAAMNEACGEAHFDIMKYLMENCNHALFDMGTVMHTACKEDELVFFKYLIDNDHALFDMKTVMNEACRYGSLEIVKYLMEMFNHACIYMNTAVNTNSQEANLSILQYFYKYRRCLTEEEIQELLNTTFNSTFNGFRDNKCEDYEDLIMLFCKTKNEHIEWSDVLNRACSVGFKRVVKWLLNNVSNAIFDLDTAILRALHFGKDYVAREIVSMILRICDHNLTDMKTVINAICHHGFTDIAMDALKDQKNFTFDLNTIMNEACFHGDMNLFKWLWESADDNLFDIKTAMIKVCRSSGEDAISILEWLWENVNRDLFDMDVAMKNACAYGRTENVKWLWMNTNTKTYQIQNALLKACEGDHVSTVRWLIMNVPEHLLNLPHALQTVCASSKRSSVYIVKILVEHADKSKLNININLLIETACKCCNINIVRYLITVAERNMMNYKNALNSVLSIDINQCQNKKYIPQEKHDLVLLILRTADPSNINIEGAIIEACKHDWVDIMKHIWLNISQSYFEMNAEKIRLACEYGSVGIIQWCLDAISLECFDINSLMVESCGYGWINIVKRVWNHEYINHDTLDMKTAMNDACTYNRFEIVTWLLQITDGLKFDMSNVLIESCRNGWIDIIKNIKKNGDSKFNDMTVMLGITEACANGHLPVIEFMFQTFGTEYFDLVKISERRTKASENEDVTMFLLRNFNCNSFDIPTILKRACSFGWPGVVKWVIHELKYNGDLVEPLNNACLNGECDIVKYLLQNVPNEKLDFKRAMLSACNRGWDDIVELLLQNVDHQKLNVRNAVIEACRCEDSDCAVLIIRQVDHKLIDLNVVLTEICKNSSREQLVLSILKTVDSSEFDQNIVMDTAKKYNWRKVLLFLNRQKS